MRNHRVVSSVVFAAALCIELVVAARAADSAVPGWDPSTFRDASTIQVMTTEPEVGEHWSNLWVVVIDGQPYVRLGDRSYGRVQRNTTSPYVKLLFQTIRRRPPAAKPFRRSAPERESSESSGG